MYSDVVFVSPVVNSTLAVVVGSSVKVTDVEVESGSSEVAMEVVSASVDLTEVVVSPVVFVLSEIWLPDVDEVTSVTLATGVAVAELVAVMLDADVVVD